MDSRFYDNNGYFMPIYYSGSNKYISCIPIVGFGRPQTDVDTLIGKDGCFLTVIEDSKTGKVVKENPANWDNKNTERFLELYGPLSLSKHRFNLWIKTVLS